METEDSLPHSPVPVNCLSWASSIQSMHPRRTSWRSILILSYHLRLGLSSAFFHSGFPTKTLYKSLLSPIRTTSTAHLILPDFITLTILGEEYRSVSSSLCTFLHSPVAPSRLLTNILLSTLFSNTLSLRSSPTVSNQISHPYSLFYDRHIYSYEYFPQGVTV